MLTANAVVGAGHGIFYVTYHGVNPDEFFLFDALRATTCDDAVMFTARRRHGGEARQAIGDNDTVWRHMRFSSTRDLR